MKHIDDYDLFDQDFEEFVRRGIESFSEEDEYGKRETVSRADRSNPSTFAPRSIQWTGYITGGLTQAAAGRTGTENY